MADSKLDPQEDNRRIVTASFDSWAAGRGGPFDLLADNASWTIVGHARVAGIYQTREAFMSGVISPFNARLSRRLIPSVRKIYAEGSTVIVFFDGEALDDDGRPYKNTYAWFLEMRGRKIIAAHAFFDSIAFDEFWGRAEPRQEN
jgi:ketosteroid isomerase-like protein